MSKIFFETRWCDGNQPREKVRLRVESEDANLAECNVVVAEETATSLGQYASVREAHATIWLGRDEVDWLYEVLGRLKRARGQR